MIPPHTDGRIYHVPVHSLSAYGMFYNKRVLERLGIDPPRDWDELLNLVELANEHGVAAIGLGNMDRWEGDLLYNMLVMRQDVNAFRNAMAGTASFTDEPFLEAARQVATLVEMDAFQRGYMRHSTNEVLEMFRADMIAIYNIGPWMLATFSGEEFGDFTGFTYFPKTGREDPVTSTMSASNDEGLVVASSSDVANEAARFIIEYARVVNDSRVEAGLAPFMYTDVQPPADRHPMLVIYDEMLSQFQDTQLWWFSAVEAVLGEPMRDLSHQQFAGEIDPYAFVEELAAVMVPR